MALDTSIIRQATFQPVQFQMPSQANMLANAAQAVSGLQTLESNRMRMRQAQQEEAATSQMLQGIKRAYAMGETPESIQAYEEALIGSGQPQYVNAGMKLRMARMEDAKQQQMPKPPEAVRPVVVGGRLVDPVTRQVVYEPPPGEIRPEQRYVPVGPNVFDRVTQTFLPPPTRATPSAPTKTPAPLRLRPGESLVSPRGEVLYTAPAAGATTGAPAAAGSKPTAAQAAKTEAQNRARQDLSDELRTVLGYYQKLSDLGAMTSPNRKYGENLIASARASDLGQAAEQAISTKAQTQRNNIANARQRILSHVKNVTGATSKQMDSNRELQIWLDSLTSPKQSMETVRETLTQLDRVMGSVSRQVEREAQGGAGRAPAAAPAAAPAPAAGNRREIAPGVFVTERP